MLPTEYRPAMQATFPRAGKDRHWTGETEAKARDGFMWLIKHAPVEEFEEWRNHPFWLHWRSHKSNSSCLHYAASNGKDPNIIGFLVGQGLDVNEKNSQSHKRGDGTPPVFHCLQRPTLTTNAFLRAFAQAGADLTATHNQKSLVFHASVHGYFSVVKFLIEHEPSLDCLDPEALARFMGHRHIDGRGSSANSQDVLKWGFDRWGTPGSDTLRELFRSSLRLWSVNDQRKPGVEFIKSLWNHTHPDWSDEDTVHLIEQLLITRQFSALEEQFHQKLFCPDEDWLRISNHFFNYLSPPWRDSLMQVDVARNKHALLRTLSPLIQSSAPTLKNRM